MRLLYRRLVAWLRSPAIGRSIAELDAHAVQDVGLEVWRGPLGVRAELRRIGPERLNSLIQAKRQKGSEQFSCNY